MDEIKFLKRKKYISFSFLFYLYIIIIIITIILFLWNKMTFSASLSLLRIGDEIRFIREFPLE
jgi:hypothetical protein